MKIPKGTDLVALWGNCADVERSAYLVYWMESEGRQSTYHRDQISGTLEQIAALVGCRLVPADAVTEDEREAMLDAEELEKMENHDDN